MRLTVRTDLALRALMCCAANPSVALRKADIARICNSSENHLAQIVSTLSAEGYLNTLRGRNGGVSLGRPADEIHVGSVCRFLEQAVPLVECFDEARNTCPLKEHCRLKPALKNALSAFYDALDDVTLADLMEENTELNSALTMSGSGPRAIGSNSKMESSYECDTA
ncbi:MAG: Rrf2 family transcriptional regulator [Pseudomonadota bacterium]